MRLTDHPQLVCGIDLGGSKLDVSLFLDGELVKLKHIKGEGGNRGAILYDAVTKLNVARIDQFDQFFVEEPIVGRGVKASLQLSQMLGAFWSYLAAHRMSDRVQLVPVTSWKKEVVGKAHASKEDVSDWLRAQHPDYHSLCDGSQDLVDAICIGLYGTRVVADSRSLVLTGGDGQPDEPGPR